jgi:hypothetical protein
MKHILNNDDTATGTIGYWLLVIGVLFLLCLAEFADAYTDTKLLATLVALKYQRLTSLITSLVENNVVVALRASNALHGLFLTVNL